MNDTPTGAPVPVAQINRNFDFALLETFAEVQGAYLDKGTSLLETLAGVNAAQASQAPSPRCATLAAHVHHLTVYLAVMEQYMANTLTEQVDWEATWQVTAVSDAEWQTLQADVRAGYDRLRQTVAATTAWDDRTLGGMTAIIAHTAYHLGEIRQMLCHLD